MPQTKRLQSSDKTASRLRLKGFRSQENRRQVSVRSVPAAGLERRPSEDCPLGHFPCGNMSICLPQVLHCNGQNDCPNGADEDNCEVEQYPDRCQCINNEIHCVHVSLRSIPQVSANVTFLYAAFHSKFV
ncbi:Relaxin receptor 2 [Anabarilius grahami]|uniref:Relaxin receptor 2 n=1 Tax=Anabarilius grahami TaxID=495550 RepID=A0A3N0XVE9_ANAGA|nr:Relaxin receptor 2 [Anabarilius grahami]